MDVNSQQAIEPSTNFQQPETSDPRDKLIAQLTQQAQQLMDELRQAREQIMYLTNNFNKQSKGNDPTNSNNPSPSIGSPKPQNSPDIS